MSTKVLVKIMSPTILYEFWTTLRIMEHVISHEVTSTKQLSSIWQDMQRGKWWTDILLLRNGPTDCIVFNLTSFKYLHIKWQVSWELNVRTVEKSFKFHETMWLIEKCKYLVACIISRQVKKKDNTWSFKFGDLFMFDLCTFSYRQWVHHVVK